MHGFFVIQTSAKEAETMKTIGHTGIFRLSHGVGEVWKDKAWLLHTGGDTVRLRPLIDEALARFDGKQVKYLPEYPETRGLGLDSQSDLKLDLKTGQLRSITSSSTYNYLEMIGSGIFELSTKPRARAKLVRVIITPTSFEFQAAE
jgi:hypothetical protein